MLFIREIGGIPYTAHGSQITPSKKSKWVGGGICAPSPKHGIVPRNLIYLVLHEIGFCLGVQEIVFCLGVQEIVSYTTLKKLTSLSGICSIVLKFCYKRH